jgi:ABC-type antimicrobial peptide transport system ATPase subunit
VDIPNRVPTGRCRFGLHEGNASSWRALLLGIDLLVADEIISMLDVSTRVDVLNLLADLKTRGVGILFIGAPAPSHVGRGGG